MSSRNPDGERGESGRMDAVIQIGAIPFDSDVETRHRAGRFLAPDDLRSCFEAVLDVLATPEKKADAVITITKIGLVPNVPPDDRFKDIPSDIPRETLFISGHALLPIPICKESEDSGFTWKLLPTSFTFYRDRQPLVILLPFECQQSSDFLKPSKEREAQIEMVLEYIRDRVYAATIARQSFYTLSNRLTHIFSRWIAKKVQRMIGKKGEFCEIVKAVEQGDKSLFLGSDLKIDPAVAETAMDEALAKRLQKTSPIPVQSCQSYVGIRAQEGWLRLSNAEGYNLADRETHFLEANVDEIISAIGEVDNILVFGLGDAEKEKFLLERILKNQCGRDLTVYGIDVGLEFHLRTLKAMRDLRAKTGKVVKYRGHHTTFESIDEIAGYIRKHLKDKARTLRISLGNTFDNFRDPWSVFAKDMTAGDMLMITTDVIPTGLTSDAREAMIKTIVARYSIPQWKEWVLCPLYRLGFEGLVSADNVEVRWDEESSEVRFIYKFPSAVDNNKGIRFTPKEVIELYRSRKVDPDQLAAEADRSGLDIKSCLMNEEGDFGCFVLQKR